MSSKFFTNENDNTLLSKIEGIFKALARSIKMAIKRDIYKYDLPSTKGAL